VPVCLRWTVPATTDITDDPRQCVTNEADAIRGMPDLTKSDQRQVTRARVMDSLVHVASSRSRGGAGNLVREPDGAEIGRHTIDQVTPPGVGRRADVWTSASLSPARVSSMVCGVPSPSFATPSTVAHRRAQHCQDGGVNHPVPTEICDITDALSLWQRLVAGAIGRPLPPAVAVDAFRRLHRGGEPGAFDSALLLCTDWQWHGVSANVIAGIVDSGILGDGDQDRLADVLLWHEQVHYRHPVWWLGATFVEYDLDSPGLGRTIRVNPNTPTTTRRPVWPPLRTWAAGHIVARHGASARDVLDHARSLPARDAAAVVTGAVRAVDDLDPDQARTVLNAALAWGHKAPRKAALERLLADGEHDLVQTLTDNDPDASIRRWAYKQLSDTGIQGGLFD
jgi:hypothetical protein